MPYFASFLRFRRSSGQEVAQLPTHDEIPFFDIINEGMKNGFRQFFRRMPTQINDYRILCETLEFLCIDILSGRNMRDIIHDFRRGKSDWDPRERIDTGGLRSLARDSAFRLLYQFLLGKFESEIKDSNMAYNATLFVVSHRRIFKYKTRKMVRDGFEERFQVSGKQLQGLNKWAIDPSSPGGIEEEDMSTEPEDTVFDSDWSC